MPLNDDTSPPTIHPRDPGETFDSIRGGHDGTETVASGSTENTLPTFMFKAHAGSPDSGGNNSGPYVVIKRIGRGGFGEVWEAVQTALNRRVAIKQLHIKAEDADEARELDAMFRQEAFTTAALDHPNIVPVYDYGTDELGRPVLAMKLVRGESWNVVILNDLRTLPPHEVLAKNLPILVDVTQAVVFAHDAGVVHRDLKPAQVMLGKYGEVLLMDWGLAILTGEPTADSHLTAHDRERIAPRANDASAPAGTPAYMAPEQTLSDASLVGPWTDIYLLGGMLYFLLTGTRPHEAQTSTAAVELAQSVAVEDPRKRAPGRAMPEDLVALAMHALRTEPRDRIASAKEFLGALREHLSGASKRRESVAITEQVIARVNPIPSDYSALAECLNELDHARLLWPENEPAAACREELLTAQARIALREGDLLLARVTTERLASAEARAALHKELNEAEAERLRREKERSALRLATTALLVVMIAGGAWFVLRLSDERQRAVVAKERADASRSRAEELLDFMIGDLRTQLQPIGRVAVLDSVGRQAEAYLSSLPTEEQGTKSLLQRVRTTTQLALLRVDQGELKHAEELLDGLKSTFASTRAQGDMEVPWLAAEGQYFAAAGRVYFEQGRLSEASEAHRAAAGRFQSLRALQPQNVTWLRSAANSLRGAADALGIAGEFANALVAYEQSITIYRELLAMRPEDGALAAELSKALTRMSVALQRNGKPLSEYRGFVDEADRLIAEASDADPENLSLRAEYAAAICDNVNVVAYGGDWTGGEERAQQALDIMAELVRKDSANLDWRSTYYSALVLFGIRAGRAGNTEKERAIFEEAHSGLASLIAQNPTHFPMMRDLLMVTNLMNEEEEAKNDPMEIARRSEMTLRLCFESVFSDARSAESREPTLKLLKTMNTAASQLFAKGDVLATAPYLESLVGFRARLVELDPTDPTLWGEYINTMSLLMGVYAARQDVAAHSKLVSRFMSLVEHAPIEIQRSKEVATGRLISSIQQGDLQMLTLSLDAADEFYLIAEESVQRLVEGWEEEARMNCFLSSQVLRRRGAVALERGDMEAAKDFLKREEEAFEQAFTFPPVNQIGAQLSEDFARFGLLSLRARIEYLEGGTEAARGTLDELLLALTPYRESRDPRMMAVYAATLIYLGRPEEAAPYISGLRDVGALPRLVQSALDETAGAPAKEQVP